MPRQMRPGKQGFIAPILAPLVSASRLSRQRRYLTQSSLPVLPKHIVLLSGGVESSTLLRMSSKSGDSLTALFFNYGQRAAKQEWEASRRQCEACGVKDILQLDVRSVSESFGLRFGERRHIPLIHRNVALLGIAASMAGQQGADRISIAVCKDDMEWYPSASRGFVEAFRGVGHSLGIEICTPLLELGKRDVILKGLQAGVQFGTTWSCMIGRGGVHCGRCGQCKSRRQAMAEAGVVEEDGFYRS